MQLYFIRHGQSMNNQLWEQTQASKGRSMDPELTDKGWQQASRLASFLRENQLPLPTESFNTLNRYGFGLTHLYSSLMVRAVATGSSVARALNMPLVGWLDLHEEGGIYMDDPETGEPLGYPGKDQAYFGEHYPELVLKDGAALKGWWNRPYETSAERLARVKRFHTELISKHGDTDDHVAIFSHGGFYNLFLRYVLGLPVDSNSLWFVLNNTAISRIDFVAGETFVAYLNRVDFLPVDLVT
ncbi:MAG TPA: histidine phosphatase family protein [Anaerolineales bacterium]|nr:histidine phosphatase family protein [Anaerolineales bacterium]